MPRLNHKGEYWDSLDTCAVYRDDLEVDGSQSPVGELDVGISIGDTALTVDGVNWPFVAGDLFRLNQRDRLELQQVQAIASFARATELLTFAGQPANLDTVTIDGKVYTFVTALSDVDGYIEIQGSAVLDRDALVAAITLGAGAGTIYAASTTLHPTAQAIANAANMDAFAKYGGTSGNLITTVASSVNLTWGAGTMSGGVDGAVTARFPVAYDHVAGVEIARLTEYDLGNVADAGVRVTFSGDHNPVTASTKRLTTAYLTGHAEIQAEWELLGMALENLATAIGQPETSVDGAGSSASPYTIPITADDFNTDNDLSWRFTGARKDGRVVLVDLWGTEVDFTALQAALQRGAPTPIPIRAKSTSGLRMSYY